MVKNPFVFCLRPANRLTVALLVDRAGHRYVLAERQAGKRRRERINLGRAGAVAIDSRVRLLETDAGGKRERLVLRELAFPVTRAEVHSLVVQTPAQSCRPL